MTSDEIDPDASPTVEYKGVKIFLCCDQCVNKFKRDPRRVPRPQDRPRPRGRQVAERDIEQMYCPVLKDRKVSSKDPVRSPTRE